MTNTDYIVRKHLEEMKTAELHFKENSDNELFHIKMDDILLRFIKELGYFSIAKHYEEASNNFWYA